MNDDVTERIEIAGGDRGKSEKDEGARGRRGQSRGESGGEEGGSWETGWTEERHAKKASGSERGKEEPGLVSGGSADSGVIGTIQKARRKPGPSRKKGQVTKACIDSRVSAMCECILLICFIRTENGDAY